MDNNEELDNMSLEEMFEEYLLSTMKLKVDSKRFGHLITSLKDAFFAGVAAAAISNRDIQIELLTYIHNKKNRAEGGSSKEGWLN